MKKLLAVILSASVIFLLAAVAVNAEQAVNSRTSIIIGNDYTYTPNTQGSTGTAAYEIKDGALVVSGEGGGYPTIDITFGDDGLIINPETTRIDLKFNVSVGTESNIRLIFKDGQSIWLHQFVEEATLNLEVQSGDSDHEDDYGNSGDMNKAGDFTVDSLIRDLKAHNGAENHYRGRKDLVYDENGMLVLERVEIWALGGTVTSIERMDLVVENRTEESSGSTNESSSSPPTGDSGYMIFIIIAAVTVAGIIIIKKVR